MKEKRDDSTPGAQSHAGGGGDDEGGRTPRETERDDVAEPDAPTTAREDAGMNTILSGDDSFDGVQDDAGDDR